MLVWYLVLFHPYGGRVDVPRPLLAALIAAYQCPDVPTPDAALAAPSTLWKR